MSKNVTCTREFRISQESSVAGTQLAVDKVLVTKKQIEMLELVARPAANVFGICMVNSRPITSHKTPSTCNDLHDKSHTKGKCTLQQGRQHKRPWSTCTVHLLARACRSDSTATPCSW